jgi:hypothetical protein
MIGKNFVYALAHQKLGDDDSDWLTTVHPALAHHDGTPVGNIESGCPACMHQVTEILEEM